MEEIVNRNQRILVIVSSWPSKEHPYLVYLYHGLKERFPAMQMFLFRKTQDREFAENLIGEQEVRRVLDKCVYRLSFSKNPIAYIEPLYNIIRNCGKSLGIFRRCLRSGYGVKKSFGQLLYANQILDKQFDLIYINALQSARHFALKSLFPSTPIIASSRGQDFDWSPSGYDDVLLGIDHLHVLGRHLENRANARGFAKDRITIIHPAILPAKIAAIGKPQINGDCFTIVSASRLVWTKGYTYGIRAFGLFKKTLPPGFKCQYVILGDGPDLEFLKTEVSRLGLEDCVVMKGWVEQEEVNWNVTRADLYMLLSIEEGFNNSVMQAQNLGLPCIVSNAGGLPDNVVNGETGFVVPRYSVEAVASKLVEIALDSDLREKMGMKAQVRMQREFSLRNQVDKYADMFNKLLKL